MSSFCRYSFKNLFQNSICLLTPGDGFGDFEEGFMVEWGKQLVIGTNYFTDPMGNVMNFEFEDDLISKGIFRVPYVFEDFYELEDLHYICTLLCGDRYFRIRIFDTNWTEIEYPGLGNSYIAEEDLVWSRFLSSFRQHNWLFLREGMEIDYNINGASCSGSANVGSDLADCGADYSLVKCLTDYDVGAS
ncbi:hypothetical protein DEO72_LG2g4203 [Vigna unguiculata]|uniref:Uncharacterized protein n=1 Tax=Vigna unguiculata TaxID=3917 RepID=A0A4D6L5Y7_VIGUN|nr:hypothetical protein DEO72_LG2g4203 [Vigna unguiculata]